VNEQETKAGSVRNPICSVTGRRCTGECRGRWCGGRLDDVPEEAIRWTKSAIVRGQVMLEDLDGVLNILRFERNYPGPEIREGRRLVVAAIKQLEIALK